MIHHREGNQKYYDLTERLQRHSLPETTMADSLDFILESNFDYLGVVRRPFLGRLGYSNKISTPIKQRFDRWLKQGKIIPLEIAHARSPYFILERQLDSLRSLGKERLHETLHIIPPLDPLIIDRRLLREAWNFEYTWEAYTPPAKRKFGYYGMPLLYQGNFVGQVELRKNDTGIDVVKLHAPKTGRHFHKAFENILEELTHFVIQ